MNGNLKFYKISSNSFLTFVYGIWADKNMLDYKS